MVHVYCLTLISSCLKSSEPWISSKAPLLWSLDPIPQFSSSECIGSRAHGHNSADTAVWGSYISHTTTAISKFYHLYSTNYTSSGVFKVIMIQILWIPPDNPFRVIPTFTHSDSLQCILVTVINYESSNTTCNSILIFQIKSHMNRLLLNLSFWYSKENYLITWLIFWKTSHWLGIAAGAASRCVLSKVTLAIC